MNSKYLEKLIQKEYQKIIQEQSDKEKLDAEFKKYGNEDALEVLKDIGAEPRYDYYNIKLAQAFVNDPASIEFIKGALVEIYPNGTARALNAKFDGTGVETFTYTIETLNGKPTFTFKSDQLGNFGQLVKKGPNNLFIDPIIRKDDKKEKSTWVDTTQTIGDWLGLIPVYGDAIDGINMIWYAARGKWFDAILSGIAIIPVVGSAVKLGVKNSFKLAKLNLNFANKIGKRILNGTPGAAAEFWKLSLANMSLSKQQYALLGAGASEAVAALTKAEKSINKWPIAQNPNIKTWLLNFRDFLKETEKIMSPAQIARLTKGGDIIKPFSKYFKTADDISKISKTMFAKFGRGVVEILKAPLSSLIKITQLAKIFRISPKNLEALALGYKAFVRTKIQKNPEFLAAIARGMPASKLKELFGNVTFNGNKIVASAWQRATYWRETSVIQQLNKSGKMDSFFAAAEKDNPIYNMFFYNKQWQLEQYFKRGSDFAELLQTKQFKNALNSILKEYTQLKRNAFGRKSLDIWYNEAYDLMSATGLTSDQYGQNPDAMLFPIIFGAMDYWKNVESGTTRKSMGTYDSVTMKLVNLARKLPYGDKLLPQVKQYDPDNPNAFVDEFTYDAADIPGFGVNAKINYINKLFANQPDEVQFMKPLFIKQIETWGESDLNPENQIQNQPSDRL